MSEKKKHIDQLINDSFLSSDSDFDSSSWEDVKNKLETPNTIDKAIYNALNPTSSTLPDGAWEDMNDALDIETVWKRIEKRPKRKPVIFWWRVAGIALLLSLVTYQFNRYFELNNNNKINLNKITQTKKIAPISDSHDVKEINNENEIAKNSIDDHGQKGQKEKEQKEQDEISAIKTEKRIDTAVNQVSNEFKSNSNLWDDNLSKHPEIEKIDIKRINLMPLALNHSIVRLPDLKDSNVSQSENSKLTVGIVGELNNTWIFDTETRLGYSKNSLVTNDFTVTPSFGLYLDYKIKPNLVLSSEIFFNSVMITKHDLYRDGNITKKETDLEYIKSTFSISKGIELNKFKHRNYLQFNGGVYIAYLKRSFVLYDNVINQMNSDYKLYDYGLKVGLSHSIDFSRFNVSYGIQSYYGLNNVFKGSTTPSYLNSTRNISYGLNIRLGYRL